MAKNTWAKGRKEPTCLVRLDPKTHQWAKEQGEKNCVTLRDWVCSVLTKAMLSGKY